MVKSFAPRFKECCDCAVHFKGFEKLNHNTCQINHGDAYFLCRHILLVHNLEPKSIAPYCEPFFYALDCDADVFQSHNSLRFFASFMTSAETQLFTNHA